MVPQNEQSQLSFMLRFNIILELIPEINLALNWVSKSIVCSQIQKKNQIDREKKARMVYNFWLVATVAMQSER